MKGWFFLLLLPSFLLSETIADKKSELIKKNFSSDAQAQNINEQLFHFRKELEICYQQAEELYEKGSEVSLYKDLLSKANEIKQAIAKIEEKWRESTVSQAKQDEEGYAIWDQEETTLTQLVMEYGSSDYLYIISPDIAGIKLNLHSNIPIPRESWTEVLEMIFTQNGIGAKKINAYTKQLYVLKQDLGAVLGITSQIQDLAWYSHSDRLFFVFSPKVEQIKSVVQFFEKFSDPKRTFIHTIGSKIGVVATKEEIEKLLTLYQTVWEGQEGKVAKVVAVTKMNIREMEKILNTFFGENVDKMRSSFSKAEQDGLGIFSLAQTNTLVLVGSHEIVERAEKVVKETEDQLEDPTEMTIFLYTCRHSNPTDLAKVLDRVYNSLIFGAQEGPIKETDISIAAQAAAGGGRVPEGYPTVPPLIVAPPPLKPGISGSLEIDQNVSEHFIPDPKTGTLLMTVRRDVLGKIKDLIKKLDIPKKMVHIEVLLFERKMHSQNNFGLNLLKLGNNNGVFYTPIAGPEVGAKGILQFFFGGSGPRWLSNYDVAYNFLMTQEDIQLNAAPSLTTVNQTPATINIVEEISINNGAAPIDSNQGTAFAKSFSRADYGITVILTPTIHIAEEEGEKGSVTLKTNITFDTQKPRAGHEDQPIVDRRHIENEVRIVDGETIILGGLRKKSKQDLEENIPFFGEIPGFGKLFGSTKLIDHDTEMFFFITPKIIYDPLLQQEKLRTEELKKRPGDLPEFLDKLVKAREKERRRYFQQSMKIFFTHDR